MRHIYWIHVSCSLIHIMGLCEEQFSVDLFVLIVNNKWIETGKNVIMKIPLMVTFVEVKWPSESWVQKIELVLCSFANWITVAAHTTFISVSDRILLCIKNVINRSLLFSPVTLYLSIKANFQICRLQSIFGGSTSGVGNKAINLSETTKRYLQTDMNWNQREIINNRVLWCEATYGILCKAFTCSKRCGS